jgi:protein gp37
MSDLFHENVPFEYIAACFGVMATSQRHTFQCLTKRPGRALEWFEWLHQQTDRGPDHKRIHPTGVLLHHAQRYSDHKSLRNTHAALTAGWPLPNVQIGVSVENQPTANERIQELLKCQAAVRFISYEPALGPVDFTEAVRGESCLAPECWGDCACDSLFGPDPGCRRNGGDGKLTRRIDWIIIGGESGHGAREFDISWARSTIEQCRQAGVPVFVKQLGSKPIVTLTNRLPGCMDDADVLDAIRSRKGADMSEWPPDLRIREFPTKQTGTHPWFGERS